MCIDLEQLDPPHQHRFLVLVRQLAGGRRKQEEREDEHERGKNGEIAVIHSRNADGLERHEEYEPVTEHVVVKGAKKLCDEKWRKPPLGEK